MVALLDGDCRQKFPVFGTLAGWKLLAIAQKASFATRIHPPCPSWGAHLLRCPHGGHHEIARRH